MEFKTLLLEKSEGIAVLTLNRPRSFNSLNAELMEEFLRVLDEIEADPEIGVMILTGHKKFFAAGADISEIRKITTAVEARPFAQNAQSMFKRLAELDRPSIAAISGLALGGGCELCLACDVRIAADNASFGLPEIKLGVLPGGGGTQRLPRLIGPGLAKEMLFSGDPINAQEAYRIGLVNKIVPGEALMDEAKKMAKTFLARPAFALRTIKALVNAGLNMDLNSALAHEARCFEILFATEDQKEGTAAFMEKRKPEFKGK